MAWIAPYQTWLTETESLNNAQMVVNHFVGTDWSKEALSAMCGNMRHESSINPDMYEYGYDWSADRGYGLVQWTPRSKYWDWATANGLEPRSGDSQLARIDYEVANNIQWIPRSDYGDMTFAEFRSNSGGWTVDYLTEAFTWSYERPNETAGWDSMPDRKAFAQRCFNELDWTGTGGGGEPCVELALFPIDILHVTQGENSEFSHLDNYWAMDFVGTSTQYPCYAPCYAECIGRDDTNAIMIWKSVNPVMCADGVIRNITWRQIHDDILDHQVGDRINKGALMGHSGNSGQSSGDHFHFEVYEGSTYDVATRETTWLHIYDVWAINNVTTIVDDWGYPWKTSNYVDCSNGGGGQTKDKQKDLIHLYLSQALHGWNYKTI